MADVAVNALATQTTPFVYTVPASQEIVLKSVQASFNGAAAAGAWVPCMAITPPGGVQHVYPLSTTLAAGASADVSWFPGLIGAGGGGISLLDHGTRGTNLNVTATTAATAQAFMTTNAVTFDGASLAMILFGITGMQSQAAANQQETILGNLYDGSTDLGRIMQLSVNSVLYTLGGGTYGQILTPSSGAHTYSLRCWSSTLGASTVTMVGADPDVGNVFCWWAVYNLTG